MKTIRFILLAMVLTLVCSTPSLAAGSFATANDLYSYWHEQWHMIPEQYETTSPYPDYVCGVWTTDNGATLTFAVTNDEAGEAGKAEILELVENDSTVQFTYQTYPHAELWAIQQALTDDLGDETGAWSIGVHEMENIVCIGINMEHPNSEAFMQRCFESYGDRVRFEDGKGIDLTIEKFGMAAVSSPSVGSSSSGADSFLFWILPLAALLVWIGFAIGRKRLPLLQTADGTVVSAGHRLSRKDTETIVRSSSAIPRTEVCQAILREIGKDVPEDLSKN